jgi:hypothetical protein
VVLIYEDPHAYVELAVEYQERLLDVLLDNERVVLDLEGVVGVLFLLRRLSLGGWSLLGISTPIKRVLLIRICLLWRAALLVLLRRNLYLFVFALAVLLDELVKGLQIAEHVDAPPSVQMRRLKKPQVIPVEMAQGKAVLRVGAFFKVEGLKLGDFIWGHNLTAIFTEGLVV